MTRQSNVLFPASVVGSMPRPDYVRELFDNQALSPQECASRMDAAIKNLVALQERAGLNVVTDGEWRRKSYIGVIAELANGFAVGRHPVHGRSWTVVVDKLTPKQPGFIAKEIAFLRQHTSRRVKATLPSPALLGERMWDRSLSAKAYPRQKDFVLACAAILRRELELLRDAGADIVQIDDPHLCLFVDPEVRARYDHPDVEADFAVEVINQMVEGMTGPTLAVHLCRRAGARVRGEHQHMGSFMPILGQLNQLHVHHLTMEFTAPGAEDMTVLRQLREDFEIGLGCVSVHPGTIDSVETIVGRVRRVLDHVSSERLTLNPDCGFAPGSEAAVSLDEAYQKLCNEVAAAKILRGG